MFINKIKNYIRVIHLWLGLISGIFIFIAALTGSILVFEKEIDRIIHPNYYSVVALGKTKKTIDQCLDVLQKEYDVKKIIRISTYNDASRTIQVLAKKTDSKMYFFSIDPYVGKVIAETIQEERFFSVVLAIHRQLLLGKVGEIIMGISCGIFTILLLTGLIIWWPKKIKKIKQRLTVKWKGSLKRINWDLHATFGIYSFLILLIITFSGLFFAFSWFQKGIYFVADGTTQINTTTVENPTTIRSKNNSINHYQNIYDTANDIFPYQGNVQFRLPADTINSILIVKENLEKVIPYQSSAAYFDSHTSKNIEKRAYESFTNGDKIKRLMYPIHTGSIYGLPTKIVAFIVCIVALTLPVTGLLIWLGKNKT